MDYFFQVCKDVWLIMSLKQINYYFGIGLIVVLLVISIDYYVIEVVYQFGENKDGNGYVISILLYGSSIVYGLYNLYKIVELI